MFSFQFLLPVTYKTYIGHRFVLYFSIAGLEESVLIDTPEKVWDGLLQGSYFGIIS